MDNAKTGLVTVLLGVTTLALGCEGQCLDDHCDPVIEFSRNAMGRGVDLLFVVDNSETMLAEQARLAAQFPELIRAVATGDLDTDGTRDFYSAHGLHLGVVTADMGAGGHALTSCSEPAFGDDGVLRSEAGSSIDGCRDSYPRFLRLSSGEDIASVGQDAGCLVQAGMDGCTVTQPLEAALKAVTPSDSEVRFPGNSFGHADGENFGFARFSSLLVIVLLTDGEDCSTADVGLFDPDSPFYSGSVDTRCVEYPNALNPVSRYVDELLSNGGNPLLTVIAGVPPSLIENPGNADFDRVLQDPTMQYALDPEDPDRLRPSCTTLDGDPALPPRRLVQAARDIRAGGGQAILGSICDADIGGLVRAVAERIGWHFTVDCFSERFVRDEAGRIDCELIEILRAEGAGSRCGEIPGRVRIGEELDGSGRALETCRVTQFAAADGEVPVGPGWYYDDSSEAVRTQCGPTGSSFRYTKGALPAVGATYRFRCAASAVPSP